jgi:hypothetical protein
MLAGSFWGNFGLESVQALLDSSSREQANVDHQGY